MQHLEVTTFDVLSVLCKDMNHWNCCSCKELKSLCWTKQQQVFPMEGVVFFHRWSCVLQLLVINDSTVSCVRLHTVDFLIMLFSQRFRTEFSEGKITGRVSIYFCAWKKKENKDQNESLNIHLYVQKYWATHTSNLQELLSHWNTWHEAPGAQFMCWC